MKPFHKIAHRLPPSLQRLEYKLGIHYLRYYPFPRENPFIPESDKVIIFFPGIGWDNMKQRHHHLPRAFVKAGWTAVYLTQDIEGDKVFGIKRIHERFFLCTNIKLLKNIKNPWIYMNYTFYMFYLHYFKEYRLIYDYLDKLEIHTFYNKKMVREHRKALQIADIVMASSTSLRDELISIRKDTLLVPNAVFPEDFVYKKELNPPADLKYIVDQRKPVIGYYGIFSKWKIDYELLQRAAAKLPEYNFVLIGPDFDHSIQDYNWENFSNIYLLGKKKYEELPDYAFFFDAAILPLLVNEITNAISPVKLFEYFAMKLPVVSTGIAECRNFKSVLISQDHEDFIAKVRKAIKQKNDPAYLALLQNDLARNTWDYRCKTILEHMNGGQEKHTNQ
ncbi:MAG TPA: glycosyltransferase [Bacteroidales bacterium]|nr:glycosyltransferase [Bacteroidales bacterium]